MPNANSLKNNNNDKFLNRIDKQFIPISNHNHLNTSTIPTMDTNKNNSNTDWTPHTFICHHFSCWTQHRNETFLLSPTVLKYSSRTNLLKICQLLFICMTLKIKSLNFLFQYLLKVKKKSLLFIRPYFS